MSHTPSHFLPVELISDDGVRLNWRAYFILALLCLAFFLPGFFTMPPVDRDEPHFAQATKQMIETSNYIDIHFQDEVRYKKPIGIYWLQAFGVHLIGTQHMNDIWAYRLPSLAGATVAVMMTALLGALLFGPLTGFLAALLMAASVILNIEARLAKTDAVLLACVMVSQYALARAYMARKLDERFPWPIAALFWTAQSLAFLVKGPILLLVTASTLLFLRFSEKRLNWFKLLRPGYGLIYTALLIAPWFIAILKASHGGFAQEAGGHDFLAKLWQGQDRGIMPPGLHFAVLPVIFFPGSLLVLLAFPDVVRLWRNAGVRFCLGWIVPTWIVFELSLTKLPHYVMPVYPALAILAVKAMLDGYPALAERRWRWLPPIAMGVWLLAGATIAIVGGALPYVTSEILSLPQLGAGLLLIGAMTASIILLPRRNGDGILLMVIGFLFFVLTSLGTTIPSLQHVWLSQEIVEAAERVKTCDEIHIATASYDEPSLVFLAGSNTLNINSGAAIAQEMAKDKCVLGLLDSEHNDAFLQALPAGQTNPQAVATFTGPNIGSGHRIELTLYRTPPEHHP